MYFNRGKSVFRLLQRYYHSENAFGFRKKIEKSYKISEDVIENRIKESNFYRLVTAYRIYGHKKADIDSIALEKPISEISELELKNYGLNENDLVETKGIVQNESAKMTIKEAIKILEDTYCKNISAEFDFLEKEEEREWFSKEFEKLHNVELENDKKLSIATEMLKSQVFDRFLAVKYPGLKRYGGEGAESMMPFFMELFQLSSEERFTDIVAAFSHRGRLNVLTGLLDYPIAQMFLRLKGEQDYPEKYQGTGDVLSHINASIDLNYGKNSVHVTILKNPSHLEIANPVSMGKTRGKQMVLNVGDYSNEEIKDTILNIQIHGDAALMGQGVNQETLNMCQTPHFNVGGSIHMVVNNQLGFTTPPERGRSSRYCTDLAKIISAPVIHVNGDYPELVAKATKLIFEYRKKFCKDIFLDINCYRQWGHNELDDPFFTNPLLYKKIRGRKSVPDVYAEKLIGKGILTEEKVKEISNNYMKHLNEIHKNFIGFQPIDPVFHKNWKGFGQAQSQVTTWNTGVELETLKFIGKTSVEYPDNFEIHPTLLKTHVNSRLAKISEGNIDWATAEALAFGSLLYEGYNVRISGQDVGRGTFSQRHVMFVDQKTNEIFIPLNSLHKNQNSFIEIANSSLSEEAVVAFEYGFSLESPKNLCIWEAQFGDFFNGAQIPVDTFITSGETKWLYSSGLTMLLPHGYDGAGPDHSSARLERILLQTDSKEDKVDGDNINIQVCQPSTPSQYFHLLRRQMIRNFRKPLVIIAPKTLLRLPDAHSNLNEIISGTCFKPVIDDTTCDPEIVKRILLTSGKHYYSLMNRRNSMKIKDTAIIRIESFSPFPTGELIDVLKKYTKANLFHWCQEEPRNMGAWFFVKARFENLIGRKISYCGREVLAVSAVGVGKKHQQEVEEIEIKPFLTSFYK